MTEENKPHTSAPWTARPDYRSEEDEWEVVAEEQGQTIYVATCHSGIRGKHVANARLIASAPDLLAERDLLKTENARLKEALCRQCDNMAFVINHMTMPDYYYEKLKAEVEEDRAALSGEPK